jgi:hypothetical protein
MLRDVDNVVTEEEIREAISVEAGTDAGDIEVRIKKPEQGGTKHGNRKIKQRKICETRQEDDRRRGTGPA